MKRSLLIPALFAALAHFNGCVSVVVLEGLANCLTSEELAALEKRALELSDREAAYKIVLHYMSCEFNQELGIKWLKVSDKLGDPRAGHWLKLTSDAQRKESSGK